MKKVLIICTLAFICFSGILAQGPPPPPPPPPGGGGGGDPITPIDGGLITLLVGAGASYFIAKKRKLKNQEQASDVI